MKTSCAIPAMLRGFHSRHFRRTLSTMSKRNSRRRSPALKERKVKVLPYTLEKQLI